jgi:hypothetical protein
MKWQRVAVVCGTALTTMAFTVMLAAPQCVDAVGAASVKPVIAQPKFESQKCTFDLKTDKEEYEPGERLALEIGAVNTSQKTANAVVWINVFESAPSSELSRMIAIPKLLWSHECNIRLRPGESKTVGVIVDVDLPEGKQISITLNDKKNEIMTKDLGVLKENDRSNSRPPADPQAEKVRQK